MFELTNIRVGVNYKYTAKIYYFLISPKNVIDLRPLYVCSNQQYLNINTNKRFALSCFSHFQYYSSVYGPCLDGDTLNRIYVQNNCIRFTYGIRKFEHLAMKIRIKRSSLIMFQK